MWIFASVRSCFSHVWICSPCAAIASHDASFPRPDPVDALVQLRAFRCLRVHQFMLQQPLHLTRAKAAPTRRDTAATNADPT